MVEKKAALTKLLNDENSSPNGLHALCEIDSGRLAPRGSEWTADFRRIVFTSSVILNRGIAIARVPYPRTKYTRSLRGRRFYARSLSRSHTDSPPASDDHPFTINEFVCPGLMIAENEFE